MARAATDIKAAELRGAEVGGGDAEPAIAPGSAIVRVAGDQLTEDQPAQRQQGAACRVMFPRQRPAPDERPEPHDIDRTVIFVRHCQLDWTSRLFAAAPGVRQTHRGKTDAHPERRQRQQLHSERPDRLPVQQPRVVEPHVVFAVRETLDTG